jgi:hypothetical protein
MLGLTQYILVLFVLIPSICDTDLIKEMAHVSLPNYMQVLFKRGWFFVEISLRLLVCYLFHISEEKFQSQQAVVETSHCFQHKGIWEIWVCFKHQGEYQNV